MNPLQRETLAAHPTPPTTPMEALAHVLAIYEDEPDERYVIVATRNVYGPHHVTGLTFGDLRRLLDDHAHELAEKLRTHWFPREPMRSADYIAGVDIGFDRAADLIDP